MKKSRKLFPHKFARPPYYGLSKRGFSRVHESSGYANSPFVRGVFPAERVEDSLKGVEIMELFNRFGVVGGDERMKYLAESLARDGHCVCTCGMEGLAPFRGVAEVQLPMLADRCDVILFPLPASSDGLFLNAPFADAPIALNDDFARLFMNRLVFGGMLQKLTQSSPVWKEIAPEDYYRREELMVGNAIPTAEGALSLAIQEYPGTINGSKCLITGFGRIGKNLALLLRALGAEVFAAARRTEDRMLMRAYGVHPLQFRDITERFDLIFNTVPTRVLTLPVLRQQDADTLIVELASAPGGVDLAEAASCGIRVLDGGSLPGRVAPKTAAEYIKEAVYNMLEA